MNYSNNKGLIEAELGNYKEALESIENLIEINSNDCDAYIMKANVLNGLKKFDDSIEWCNKAIRIDSNKPEVFIIKGI
jgi:tetratricopeptide (TPR) repeat protein